MAGAAKDGDDLVQVAFDNQVAWVTLNRPEKRNAMNPALNARDARGAGRAGERRRAAACWC